MARVFPSSDSRFLRGPVPGFGVLESRRVLGGVPGPISRALLCELEDSVQPLEVSAPPPSGIVSALATDDDRVLYDLLKDATVGKNPEVERRGRTDHVRIFRSASPDFAWSVRRQLEASTVRPLANTTPKTQVAIFPLSDPALSFYPVHRAIRGLPNFRPEPFLNLVREFAEVIDLEVSLEVPAGRTAAENRLASLESSEHAVLAVFPFGRAHLLRFRRGLTLSQIRGAPVNPTLRCLDLSLLDALVLRATLGIRNPENLRHANVVAWDGLDSLWEGVRTGAFQAGFVLRPPPNWELRAVMEASVQLPPRTLKLAPSVGPELWEAG